MNSLDSRSLRIGDCYAQKFDIEGEVRYALSHSYLTRALDKDDFLITVNKRAQKGEPAQHTVHVTSKNGELTPDLNPLEIASGDIVLWYTTHPSVLGFAVTGVGPKFAFGSGALRAEGVYTHAFGVPGTFDWVNPLDPKIYGSVDVKAVDARDAKQLKAWYALLEKPAAFEIKDGKVSPKRVDIVVGQTVFWKVWNGDGVAITDKRLAEAGGTVYTSARR
jgi:plastocyanin